MEKKNVREVAGRADSCDVVRAFHWLTARLWATIVAPVTAYS